MERTVNKFQIYINTIIKAINNIIWFCKQAQSTNMGLKNISKNLACACFGLCLISISAIVMTQIYFGAKIDTQISNISILKE